MGAPHPWLARTAASLESEGAEIHFRNIRILELPPGLTREEQTAPVAPPTGK